MADTPVLGDLKRGDTWTASFFWKSVTCDDDGNVISKSPTNLTGCSARLHLEKSGATVLDISTLTGEITIDGLVGQVDINVAAAVTAQFESGSHKGDLEITYPTGVVHSSETFLLTVLKDITV